MADEDIAEAVRHELARRRKSRAWLADAAGISLSTLEKALAGKRAFTLATRVRLEEVLERPLDPLQPQAGEHGAAPERLGGYSRTSVKWLEGDYVMLRPSAGEAGSVYAHGLSIHWDAGAHRLLFRESHRADADYTQGGEVGVSSLSGHIYLVTNELGQFRLVILGRPTKEKAMHGVLTTLMVGAGTAMMPAASPVVLLQTDGERPAYGRVSPGDAMFESYRAHLDRVLAGDYARLLT